MTLTDWVSLGGDLLAVVIVTTFVAPLFFLPREAPVVAAGLAAVLLLGFSGPFLNQNGQVALYVMGLALVIAMPVAVGRRAQTGGAAAMGGATFIPLAFGSPWNSMRNMAKRWVNNTTLVKPVGSICFAEISSMTG